MYSNSILKYNHLANKLKLFATLIKILYGNNIMELFPYVHNLNLEQLSYIIFLTHWSGTMSNNITSFNS